MSILEPDCILKSPPTASVFQAVFEQQLPRFADFQLVMQSFMFLVF